MSDLLAARPPSYPITAYNEFGSSELAPFGDHIEPSESILRHYWRVFYRRRWIILAITAGCVALALLISMLMQRQYTAIVRVQIEREAAKVVDVQSVDDTEQSSSSVEFYQTQYALLKSRSLSESVARDLRLADNFTFLSGNNARNIEGLKAVSRADRFARATAMVNAGTQITPVRGSSIVDIGFVAPNPGLAAAVANAIAENFIETNLSRRFEATTYARQFLQNRIAAIRGKLEESERKAAQYAQAQGIIKISGEGGSGAVSSEQTLASSDLTQLSAQLANARAARAQAEADYRANSGGSAATTSLQNPAVNQLRQERAALSGELSKLESDYGPEYPKVAALRSQIAEINRQLGREQGLVTSSVAQGLRDRYRQALAAENGIQSRVNGLKSAVLDQQQRSIQFNIIQRDVDTNRALYDALLQRFKEVGVAAGVGTNNVSVVDSALPPKTPSRPNLPLNLTLGLLLGLLLGGASAIVLEQLSESIVLPSEFQSKLGVKLLGTTPKMGEQSVATQLREDRSPLSEAYFSILTGIQFSTPRGTPSSLLFTSAQPGEGKSTTSVSVARGLAGIGAKVLLIDADMRNPSLHRLLGKPLTRGLSDVLSGEAEYTEVLQETDVPTLTAMLAGPIPLSPPELLAKGALTHLLQTLGEQYDHIIIDGPPVLGLADAPLLARAAEGTIFVTESGRTRASQSRTALERLFAVRANVLGAVLTKLDANEAGYGQGYGYQYHYGSEKR